MSNTWWGEGAVEVVRKAPNCHNWKEGRKENSVRGANKSFHLHRSRQVALLQCTNKPLSFSSGSLMRSSARECLG